MRFRYVVSYESDIQPVETVRGEFEVDGGAQAVRQGAREGCRQWPTHRKFRSVVVVVERLEVGERAEVDSEATRFA